MAEKHSARCAHVLGAVVVALGGAALAMASVAPAPVAAQEPGAVRILSGDSAALGAGFVTTWVEVDAEGAPYSVGVTLPMRVVESTPGDEVMLSLDFPEIPGLPIRHVLFDWVPHGHPPAHLYSVPHWDAHFYLITSDERRAIRAGPVEVRPDAALLPEPFIPVPELGLYSFPEMGVHWVDRDAPEVRGEPFERTLIYGSDGDRVIFIEPMFTAAFLDSRPDHSAEVPQPAEVAQTGWYPTRYVIRYLPDEDAFRVSLEGFRAREAAR